MTCVVRKISPKVLNRGCLEWVAQSDARLHHLPGHPHGHRFPMNLLLDLSQQNRNGAIEFNQILIDWATTSDQRRPTAKHTYVGGVML